MVSAKLESSYLAWRPVNRPFPKPKPVSIFRTGPPPPPPRPGGKVFVYVYEAPRNLYSKQSVNFTGSGVIPPKSQQTTQDILAPDAINSETTQLSNLNKTSNAENSSDTINKLKRQAKKAGEGYKLLADVDDQNQCFSSRGGKMFLKQQQRMKNYTSSPSLGLGLVDEFFNQDNSNLNVFRYNTTDRRKKKNILPALRSPPPEWRAKVEANYSLFRDERLIPKTKWSPLYARQSFTYIRSESAPPPELENQTNDESFVNNEERQSTGSVAGMRSEMEDNVIGKVHYDAKKQRQKHRRNRSLNNRVVVAAPHLENDFNARAVGWSKAYAKYY